MKKVQNIEELRRHYKSPSERASNKVQQALDVHTNKFIQLSPFLVISTISKQGKMDASPRGGDPGFVKVLDQNTLIVPDSKGNNRLDSLENILESNRVGCLFLIPGMDETLRLNGSAEISIDPEHLDHFSSTKNTMATCIVINIEEVFMHCAKALMRSKLWSSENQIDRSIFPSIGEILKDQLGSTGPAETQEQMLSRYYKSL